MKTCPRCGRKFNWWERAVGEDSEHVRLCCGHHNESSEELALASRCKGCPAGCFEGVDLTEKKENELGFVSLKCL